MFELISSTTTTPSMNTFTNKITKNNDKIKNDNNQNNEIFDDDYESMPETSGVGVHMMAGAMAGMMEHVLMYPLDSVKVKYLKN